jgi:hypothetical protein
LALVSAMFWSWIELLMFAVVGLFGCCFVDGAV